MNDNIDYTLSDMFRKKQEESSIKKLRNQVEKLTIEKEELDLTALHLRQCINEIDNLQEILLQYSQRAKNIIKRLDSIESALSKR